MQVGIITMDGRQIGTVSFSADGMADEPFAGSAIGEDAPAPGLAPHIGLPHRSHDGHGAAQGPHRHFGHQSSSVPPTKPRYGGEGDLDSSAKTGGSKLNLPPSVPVKGDRVHGGFATARDRARRELEEKPWLNEKAMHIFAGENPHPEAATALWESAINRAAVRNTSLEKQLRRHASSGKDESGYYAGWNSTVAPQVRKTLEAARDRALGYSNVSGYATDNSSGDLARRERATGSFIHRSEYNREHFFAPGSSQPVNRERWHKMVRDSEDAKAIAKADHPKDMKFDPETMAP